MIPGSTSKAFFLFLFQRLLNYLCPSKIEFRICTFYCRCHFFHHFLCIMTGFYVLQVFFIVMIDSLQRSLLLSNIAYITQLFPGRSIFTLDQLITWYIVQIHQSPHSFNVVCQSDIGRPEFESPDL